MLILILLVYGLPVYLIFFQFKLIKMTRFWKVVLWIPPVVALVFLWFALGHYTPTAQDAYVQAPVIQVGPQVSGVVIEVLVKDDAAVKKGDALFRIDADPYQYRVDQAQAKLIDAKQQALGLLANVYAAAEGLRQAEASLELARKGAAAAQADLEAAQAGVSKAKAQVDLADSKASRNARLLGSGAVTKEEYDESVRTLAVNRAGLVEAQQRENKAGIGVESATVQAMAAESAIREARAQRAKAVALVDPIVSLRRAVESTEAEVKALRSSKPSDDDATAHAARVKDVEAELAQFRSHLAEADKLAPELEGEAAPTRQARQALNQANYDLGQAVVRAPADGVVTNLQLTAGTYVAAGKPVVSLIETSSWRVVAPLPENWLARVRPGDEVTLTLRDYPLSFRKGKVEHVGRGVISGQGVPSGTLPDTQPRGPRQTDTPETTQDFPVSVSIADDRPDEPLRVGATGRAVVFADGGMAGVNQVAQIITTIMAVMDCFYPKPSLVTLLLGAVIVLSIVALFRYIRRRSPGFRVHSESK
jgi:multidrug resistance efflux pump